MLCHTQTPPLYCSVVSKASLSAGNITDEVFRMGPRTEDLRSPSHRGSRDGNGASNTVVRSRAERKDCQKVRGEGQAEVLQHRRMRWVPRSMHIRSD